MKNFALLFAMLAAALVVMIASHARAAGLIINQNGAATVLIVDSTAGKAVHLKRFFVVGSGAGTFKLIYGTKVSTNCDTGATDLTGPMTFATGAPLVAGDGVSDLMILPVGKQLCFVLTGSVQLSGFVTASKY